ncbi:retention module-containing protein, partial [Marinobacterium lacunae]|uniref:retention module-containing protein n=1 Tax=Marinobacterium lacunae TaxID=1232683 RepID=UPI00055AFAA6
MSYSIGNISFLNGSAVAVTPDGSERALALGDAVMSDDVVRTSDGARLEIALSNGEAIVVNGSDTWSAASAGMPQSEADGDAVNDIVGTVDSVVGQVVAVAADGSERVLMAGDAIYADEVIRTGPDAQIEISMSSGGPVVLEGGQSWLATSDTYTPADQFDTSEAVADTESFGDVDAIQAAILAGQDPTAIGEATAAGTAASGAGGEGNDGGADFVALTRTGGEVDPTAGYNTIGISSSVTPPQSEELALVSEETVPTLSINDVSVVEPDNNASFATNVGDATVITTTISSSEGDVFSFDWNFFAAEGEYGQLYNDFAFVVIDGEIYTLASYSNSTFSGGQTGTQTFSIELGAGDHQIAIGVADVGDSEVASPLTVDNVSLNGVSLSGLNFESGLGDWSATGSASVVGDYDGSEATEGDYQVVLTADHNSVAEVESAAGLDEGALGEQAEGNASSSVVVTFTVTLSEPAEFDVSVDFVTADGTAISGGSGVAENDYGSTSGTLIIPAGSTSGTIQVTVNGDNYQEGDEQFLIELSNPVNADIADGTGVGTIIDNDNPVFTLTAADEEGSQNGPFDPTANSVDEGDTAYYVITLSGADIPAGQTVVLDLSSSDGTALYLADYGDMGDFYSANSISYDPDTKQLTLEGPLSKGDAVAYFGIETVDDVYDEPVEDYTVSLTDSTVGTAEGTVTTTIHDDNDGTTLTLGDISVDEGSGNATLTATLSDPAGKEFTVTLSNGATITFAEGETTGTSTEFPIQGDDVYIDGESYDITVADAGDNGFEALDTSSAATVTVSDTQDTVTVKL